MGILPIMPSGRTHLRIEIGLFVVTAAVVIWLGRIEEVRVDVGASFLGGYLFSSFFLSPDLDLQASRPMRRWGPLRVLWAPYAAAFRHRRLSHHPLLGPTTRLAYLGAWIALIIWITAVALGRPPSISWPVWPIMIAFLMGAYLPNEIHIGADWMVSAWKRRGSHRR
ncbi:metal-binding protein [Candidatus Bipolaricaulota bacterium]|nr:metal-binding protein [Candidatus Bipolaricaulota bacterium]